MNGTDEFIFIIRDRKFVIEKERFYFNWFLSPTSATSFFAPTMFSISKLKF